MQAVLLYDPRRVPKDWVSLLRPGQFAVLLLDLATCVIVDQQGVPVANRAAENCFVFDSLDGAKQFCQELVERVEHVRCEIYDERGKAVEPLYTIVNKRHASQLMSKRHPRLLITGGILSFVLGIPLFWLDWLDGGAKIWPTLLGINLVVLAIRLIYWGYSELAQLRRHEAEQAVVEARSKASGKAGD
jgi:hypothetical protein